MEVAAESRLRHGGYCGNMGLGYLCKTHVGKTQGKERHHLLQEEV